MYTCISMIGLESRFKDILEYLYEPPLYNYCDVTIMTISTLLTAQGTLYCGLCTMHNHSFVLSDSVTKASTGKYPQKVKCSHNL